ncbi:MAG: DNA gyrase subunit A, partial [Spirochaetes bacterium]|nr:DNA gyrase subunit A [Spirochaetota bacterium]
KNTRGKSLKGIINLASGEMITAICSVNDFSENFLCMVTRNGVMKKTALEEFSNVKKGGIIAINLHKDDELVDVKVVKSQDDVVIATRNGLLLRTNIAKMRAMGRNSSGIIGMRVAPGDQIIAMDVVKPGSDLCVVTSRGYGKKTQYSHFATKGRGGKGMAYLKISEKNGYAVGVRSVHPEDEVIIASKKGMTIRLKAKEISYQGRTAAGVLLLQLDKDDEVTDFAVLYEEKE